MGGKLNSKRPKISFELRERVAEELLPWIKRNRGHRIPAWALSQKYGLSRSQVTTVVRYLISEGKIVKISRFTYAAIPPPPGQAARPARPKLEVSAPSATDKNLIEQVTEMAKDFKWQTNSDSLKEFIESLEEYSAT